MKRRVIALLLVLALGLSMVPFAAAAEYEGLHQDRILPAMRDLMLLVEGNYTSVTRNDSNALSIGFIQWHGGQALNLLKAIVDRDPESAQKILGDDLLSQIVNGNYDAWYYRTLTAEEGKRVSELLGTKAGMEVQDEFAYAYFLKFIDAGWKMGMRTDATICYYCTMYNQYGSGGIIKYMDKVRATMGVGKDATFYSMEALHQAVKNTSYGQAYIHVREKTYNYLKTLGWNTTGPDVDVQPQPKPEPDCENCPCAAFTDMPPKSNWAHDGIDYVVSHGLFNGVSKTSFDPNGGMTRAMLVTVLYRLAAPAGEAPDAGFADVPEDIWYTEPVNWAAEVGVVSGVSETEFDPNGVVTREQIATFLFRYAHTAGRSTATGNNTLAGFRDGESVSDYAVQPMIWASSQGLINGTGTGNDVLLDPQGTATRAQVAAILMRYCK